MGRPPGEGGIRGCLCRQSEISDTRTGWEEGSGILSDGRSAVPLGGCHHRRPPAEAFPSSSWASSPNLDGGICSRGARRWRARGGSAREGLAQSWRPGPCSRRQPGRGAERRRRGTKPRAHRCAAAAHPRAATGRTRRSHDHKRQAAGGSAGRRGRAPGRVGGGGAGLRDASAPPPSARQEELSARSGSALHVCPTASRAAAGGPGAS